MDGGVTPKTDRKEEEEMEEKRYYRLEEEGLQTSVDNGKRGFKQCESREKGNLGNLVMFCVCGKESPYFKFFLLCVDRICVLMVQFVVYLEALLGNSLYM